jgi:hypothetical protein
MVLSLKKRLKNGANVEGERAVKGVAGGLLVISDLILNR